jgi:hypothetical protein
MPDLIINIIFPIIFGLGIIALYIKSYLNFKYFKIAYHYPVNLKYFQFLGSFKYFGDIFQIILPFFLKINLESLTDEEKLLCTKLEKYMFICLIIFYIGLLIIPLGIKLQKLD